MKQATVGMLVAAALAASGCSSDRTEISAAASCAAPVLLVGGSARPHPTVIVHPGQTLSLRGRYFVSDCYDTGRTGSPPPIRSVRLVFVAGDGRRTGLATAHPAGSLGTFATDVAVPRSAAPGHGRITATRAAPVAVLIRR